MYHTGTDVLTSQKKEVQYMSSREEKNEECAYYQEKIKELADNEVDVATLARMYLLIVMTLEE